MSNTTELQVKRDLGTAAQGYSLQALWIFGFAAATAVGARFEIPHQPVPYTLQTLMVLLAGGFLGARNGAISQLIYLGAGAVGAPVFAGGAFGFAALLGPTGGYLLSFPLASAAVGAIVEQRRTMLRSLIAMATGLLIVFTLGTLHLYAFYLKNLGAAIASGFLIFTWWDLLKLVAAAMTYRELAKRWPRLPMRGEK